MNDEERLDKHSIRVRGAEDSIHDLTATQLEQLKWQASVSTDIMQLRKELNDAKRKRTNNTRLIITLLIAVVPVVNAAVSHFWPVSSVPTIEVKSK